MLLKNYVTEALQDKLAKRPTHAEKPWMKFAGIAANARRWWWNSGASSKS